MAILEVKNLSKQYGGVSANSNVSFEVQTAMILGLIGPNGAGKTTLFNCVTGFDAPTSGTVKFDGHMMRGKRPDEICRMGLARTWQKVRPLAKLTVCENVLVGALLRTSSLRQAREAALCELEAVGLLYRANVPAGALPIGERKKLEIARLLATQPKLVLFDEIMGGLNPAEREAIIQLIFELKARRLTQVIIEHDMKAIMRISDRIVVLNSGEKLAEGTPREISNHAAVVKAYLGEAANA
jgi:branched-chain amino acid transport system ATP-binding protein